MPRNRRREEDLISSAIEALEDEVRCWREGPPRYGPRDEMTMLIRYPQINRSQLFNLKDDPAETHDLAAEPASASKIQELIAELEAEQKRQGDTLALTSSQPRNAEVDAAFFQRSAWAGEP